MVTSDGPSVHPSGTGTARRRPARASGAPPPRACPDAPAARTGTGVRAPRATGRPHAIGRDRTVRPDGLADRPALTVR